MKLSLRAKSKVKKTVRRLALGVLLFHVLVMMLVHAILAS